MSIPYNDDTRETYLERMRDCYIELAKRHHALGNELSMWLALFNWAMCEDIYGSHWDKLQEKKQ